jgi:hypothetical protein
MKMADLITMFPRVSPRATARTGVIPMDYFVTHEAEIRAAAAEEFGRPYRVIFRGPRPYRDATMTRRADATGAVLYLR